MEEGGQTESKSDWHGDHLRMKGEPRWMRKRRVIIDHKRRRVWWQEKTDDKEQCTGHNMVRHQQLLGTEHKQEAGLCWFSCWVVVMGSPPWLRALSHCCWSFIGKQTKWGERNGNGKRWLFNWSCTPQGWQTGCLQMLKGKEKSLMAREDMIRLKGDEWLCRGWKRMAGLDERSGLGRKEESDAMKSSQCARNDRWVWQQQRGWMDEMEEGGWAEKKSLVQWRAVSVQEVISAEPLPEISRHLLLEMKRSRKPQYCCQWKKRVKTQQMEATQYRKGRKSQLTVSPLLILPWSGIASVTLTKWFVKGSSERWSWASSYCCFTLPKWRIVREPDHKCLIHTVDMDLSYSWLDWFAEDWWGEGQCEWSLHSQRGRVFRLIVFATTKEWRVVRWEKENQRTVG